MATVTRRKRRNTGLQSKEDSEKFRKVVIESLKPRPSIRIRNRKLKMTDTANGSDVNEFKMEGNSAQVKGDLRLSPAAEDSPPGSPSIPPSGSVDTVESAVEPQSEDQTDSHHATTEPDIPVQQSECLELKSEEPSCDSEDVTPSVPDVGPSRYKTAPKDTPKFSGCAEDTWSEKDKRRRSQRISKSKLYKNITKDQWPIVYSSKYNISFLKLETLHVFDSKKWGRIADNLKASETMKLTDSQIMEPSLAEQDDLLVVHSDRYLKTLEDSSTVANITEIPPLWIMPNFLIQRQVLKPLRWQTGGSVLAVKLAMERGWAINIGGGFHHCCAEMGGGFCAFADITISLKFLFEMRSDVTKAMIVDLDAHQGNGHERDFYNDNRVYVMDVYNTDIYPRDSYAKEAIKKKIPVHCGIEDDEYLKLVETNLVEALEEFTPQVIVYNAGTDVLEGDPLGKMAVSKEGVTRRDEIVFREARNRGIPIAMVTSGGYQKCTADAVSDSIINLYNRKLIDGPTEVVPECSDGHSLLSYCTIL